jgi:hypothetical protein
MGRGSEKLSFRPSLHTPEATLPRKESIGWDVEKDNIEDQSLFRKRADINKDGTETENKERTMKQCHKNVTFCGQIRHSKKTKVTQK